MRLAADLHTHTLMSGHAYSSLQEMARAAADAGIEFLGLTEHGPRVPGSCPTVYFENYKVIERHIYGIELAMGAEINILDFRGTLDLPGEILAKQDICIAGIHNPCYTPGSVRQNTDAYLRAMENPLIDIISHPDDSYVPVDYRELVLAAKEFGVLLELNNSSLHPQNIRAQGNCAQNMRTMLALCAQYEVSVILSSDAHFFTEVGRFERVQRIVEECGFPEALVANATVARVKAHLHRYKEARV